MIAYTTISIFNSVTGAVVRVVTLPDSELTNNILAEEDCIIGIVNEQTHYINLVTKQPTPFPTRPTPFHQFDFATKQWVDSRTLEQMQALAWGNMKSLRSQKEAAGFSWDGSVFDSDQVSQSRITGAVLLAMMNPNFETTWILRDNSTRTLSASDILAVGAALGAHIAPIFPRSQELRLEIYAATTIAEVEAITWDVQ